MNQLLKIGENYLLLTDEKYTMEAKFQLKKMWDEVFPDFKLAVLFGTRYVDVDSIKQKLMEEMDAKEED